ncbi:hypothetical protein ROZALSC1DRAFT_23124 [Rozella allomycis CSF55]|uniref:Uncharacterized protein n=1 Tax=Rozella allomycis (strain CSF55) TaxID=988480 RepID=A0A4P9YGC0_ROZAC|nr:hypothetical protein ROZALSC1DRAFT_23124 [Rozella allomycis CSF55]
MDTDHKAIKWRTEIPIALPKYKPFECSRWKIDKNTITDTDIEAIKTDVSSYSYIQEFIHPKNAKESTLNYFHHLNQIQYLIRESAKLTLPIKNIKSTRKTKYTPRKFFVTLKVEPMQVKSKILSYYKHNIYAALNNHLPNVQRLPQEWQDIYRAKYKNSWDVLQLKNF